MDKTTLPAVMKMEDLINGEYTIPEKLDRFFKALIGGKDIHHRDGVNCHRLSNSLASDAIYCVSNGTVKPSKHITLAVVTHTMEQAQVVGKECNQTYVQVTYDLAIAKIAYKIQSTSKPQFNNLFIHLGSFHLMMAFFKAIGVFRNECGLSHMMIESNTIASDLVSLVEGKHFNRCKRLHPLMALGLKMSHFDHFLDNIEYNFLKEQVIDDLLNYQEVIDSHSSMPIELPNNVLSAYQKFVEETRQATRQRWTKSHSIRATIISHVLDVCGLKQLQDVPADLQPNRIKIYGKQLSNFNEIFENNINPFDESLDNDSLYNIATAKPVPENVANFC
ncbi:uncharacterized protein TNCV_1102491 [Trichonephila clavipes]|nr:uncharacterized protein TNCV_1102491 [Trichonephila clavipes]